MALEQKRNPRDGTLYAPLCPSAMKNGEAEIDFKLRTKRLKVLKTTDVRPQTLLSCLSQRRTHIVSHSIKTQRCMSVLKGLLLVAVWMWNVSHRSMYQNPLPPVDGAVWEDYRTFRRWNLARGKMSLWEGFEFSYPDPTSRLLRWWVWWAGLILLQPCSPRHDGLYSKV